MPELIAQEELDAALRDLDGWGLVEGGAGIEKEFLFKGFSAAFGFISRVALAAERHNHHPEWSNVYNRVIIRWTTHSKGGVTDLDLKLARICERIVAA